MKGRATAFVLMMTGVAGCTTVQETVGSWTGSDRGLSALDTNGDGVISQQEAEGNPQLAESFDRIDSNSDQNINSDEIRAAYTRVAETDFQQLDFNSDGVVSEREAQSVPPSLREAFDRVDADGDGNVSQSEYQAARLNLLGGTEFASFDTDSDGVIDDEEAASNTMLSDDFDSIDVDDDSMISEREFDRAQR